MPVLPMHFDDRLEPPASPTEGGTPWGLCLSFHAVRAQNSPRPQCPPPSLRVWGCQDPRWGSASSLSFWNPAGVGERADGRLALCKEAGLQLWGGGGVGGTAKPPLPLETPGPGALLCCSSYHPQAIHLPTRQPQGGVGALEVWPGPDPPLGKNHTDALVLTPLEGPKQVFRGSRQQRPALNINVF